MGRGQVEYLDCTNMPREPALSAGLPLGLVTATLSEDEQSGAVTYIGTVAPTWQRPETGYFEAAVELLILDGDLIVGDHVLTRGCYSYLPAGAWHGRMRSEQGCEFFLMFDGQPNFVASGLADSPDALRIDRLDVMAMPWAAVPDTDIEGREARADGDQITVKWLRTHPDTGAYTLLARQAPGWSEPKIEAHRTWEELILIEGDYLMSLNGLVQAGTYIFRPTLVPHGPQATRHGSVWFSRGGEAIDFQFNDSDYADGMIEEYLAATGDDDKLRPTPWGYWSK